MYCFSKLLSSPSLLRLPLVSPRTSIIIVHYNHYITTINFSLVSVEVSLHLEEEKVLQPNEAIPYGCVNLDFFLLYIIQSNEHKNIYQPIF